MNQPPAWVASLEAQVDQIPGVRRRARAWLVEMGVEGLVLDDAALAIAELLANAVQASKPAATIQIEIGVDDDAVTIAVSNTGAYFEPPDTDDAAPLRARGRGLQMVRAAADHVQVEYQGGVSTVSCTFRRDAASSNGR